MSAPFIFVIRNYLLDSDQMTGLNDLHRNVRSRAYDYICMRNIFNIIVSKTFLADIRILGKTEELFDPLSKRKIIKQSYSCIDQDNL